MKGFATVFLASLWFAMPASAQVMTCRLDFEVVVTQGVGEILNGDRLAGTAEFQTTGRTLPQEGDGAAWFATGEMRLGPDIAGTIWMVVTAAGGPTADLIGIYAEDVEGLSFAGIDFEGPMALTLYGRAGTLDGPVPPMRQEAWDRLDLRRAFTLAAHGYDMLTGSVAELRVECA
ncbi:hypothetical protein [Roseicyclus sp.]|uniref:hypothetical protein n=1 Tax=Roseicyclus sp. TaxID=1914329 RepID=UPI003F9FD879